jgi:hypothetical protein
MKTISVILLLHSFISLLLGQQISIKVENPASFDRSLETIEIPWTELQGKMEFDARYSVSVFENQNEIVCQVIDMDGNGLPDLLLFQSGFKSREEKTFVVRAEPAKLAIPVQTNAKYILPRKDVAWENDRIAYRIYGGPLAGNVLNGLDVWVKRVRYQIIDKWYDGDSLKGKKRISYHVDHGEGADMFDVGKSLGAGACGLWINGKIDQPGLFVRQQIAATGPIRTIFTVWYEKDSIGGLPFREEATYTLDEGKNLNRIQVRYSGIDLNDPIHIAAGLVKRNNVQRFSNNDEAWLSMWGPVNSDSTNEFLGTGIVIPGGSFEEVVDDSSHCLIIAAASADRSLTYYAGAGWTKSRDFATMNDWNSYLSQWSRCLKWPLNIIISDSK